MKTQRTSTASKDPNNLSRWQEVTNKVLSGNVSYGSSMSNSDQSQNLHVWKASGTTPGSANTEFHITYHLDHKALTIVGQDLNAAGSIYRSSTPWTYDQTKQQGIAYLKSSAASAAYNLILG